MPGLVVAVDDHRWRHGEHHEEVGESEVDDEQVRGCAQTLCRGEDVHNHTVADARDNSQAPDDKAEDGVPQRVHGWELVPVRVDHVQHVSRDLVDNGHVAEGGRLPAVAGRQGTEMGFTERCHFQDGFFPRCRSSQRECTRAINCL